MGDADAGILGLFGGTFDPPHIGHLRLAIEAREALGLVEVCFIPAGNPPLRDAPQGAAEHRLAMVERAIAGLPGFSVDPGEVQEAAQPSYTVATLERQRQVHGPSRPLVLLLGADAFSRLEAWQRWRELFGLAHIAVATRPGHDLGARQRGNPKVGADATALGTEFRARQGTAADLATAPAGRIVPFAITALEISATAIRERLARGGNARHLVPDAVLDYIDSHPLYRIPHGHQKTAKARRRRP
ncbi:MAG: nicotinate-nucleotide adenylyltransferase [Rhodocyclales bacterium]|nr:nicotinate-nucleotide adenylyltransferase [Rhodocyclales bacterium]